MASLTIDEQAVEHIVRQVVAELAPGLGILPMGGAVGWAWEEAVRVMIDNGACRVSSCGCATRIAPELAGNIDHTLLKPDASPDAIGQICREALEYRFASVCVNPCYVDYCARYLKGSSVAVCTVVGFPLGATTNTVKAYETAEALKRGATEIDMVLNVGFLKGRQYEKVLEDIRSVVLSARGHCTKVILETALLTDEEKVAACTLAKEAGADFVKTSTGFSTGGATVEDVSLMRRAVGPQMGVKASGGIRDTATAQAMLQAGANRIGASASVKIVAGEKA